MKIEGLQWKKLEGEDDGPQVSMNKPTAGKILTSSSLVFE